jgi:putative ABC transport system permease protein
MQLAWKEMRHNWRKYLLVEVIVILMMFMVIFL